ncbi:sialate O-acetylesterase [Flammeovirgaceae bacterium SG7u.111]|nr:sialate O-acetylesterase [Flammeovirgaceae bacterium SG7u.132]WPO37554.1 sialate O-acetylesterase [Flammeovirgaceae bacterium SG7u.111]
MNNTKQFFSPSFFFLLLLAQLSFAEVQPALLFSDNMVIQRNVEVPVWGWADRKERVTVRFNGQVLKAKPNKAGKWMVKLAPTPAGGPYEMVISGKKGTTTVKNIMVGEVWVCSGQSNMEWVLENTKNAEAEIASANHPMIRHFKVPKKVSHLPLDKLDGGEWEVCSPNTAASFTAVGYYFAKELLGTENVAIGLLNTSWGGTIVETWISAEAINTIPTYGEVVTELQASNLGELFNKRKAALVEKLGDLPTKDAGYVNGKGLWASPELDRSDWKPIELPGLWEGKGLDDLDGVVWLSKEIELTDEQVENGITINLGPIDDQDITWVNGVKVGETPGPYNKVRTYYAANSILKTGKNLIVVRVNDTGGGGGIYPKPEDFYIESNKEKLSLVGEWQYKVGAAEINISANPNSKPTLLYNAMVNPLIPFAFKGAIWYQGESNAGQAYQYRENFPLMIKDWRQKWGIGDFPFLWVQLANYMAPPTTPTDSEWAELREAQTKTLSLPNTGMAVIIDIGEEHDIHPRNKEDVGKRLSLAARKVAYGEDLVYSSPMYKSMKVEGNKIRISFDHVGSGLEIRDKYGYLNGFAIAGADKKFYWAKAEIEGNEVIVYSDKVEAPVAVRYGWADNPDDLNLYNKEGLPANPFRTDAWDGITKDVIRRF